MSDEIILLFFRVAHIGIRVFGKENIDSFWSDDISSDKLSIICDAEKAYVRMLNPEYNEVKFKHYPKGADGLYGEGLKSYAFILGEDIALSTETANIKGNRIKDTNSFDSVDMITVEGNTVTLIKGYR